MTGARQGRRAPAIAVRTLLASGLISTGLAFAAVGTAGVTNAQEARSTCLGGSFNPDCGGATVVATNEAVAPPPPPQVPYWLVLNGQQAGPFTLDQLRNMVASGQLTAGTLVWTNGMAGWEPARDVQAVAALLDGGTVVADQGGGNEGGGEQSAAASDPTAFLAGTWQVGPSQVPLGQGVTGTVVQRFAFARDGSLEMSGETRATVQGQELVITNAGRGTFSASRDGERMTIQPRVELVSRAPGMPDERGTWSDTLRLRVVDRETMADPQGGVMKRIGG